MKKLFIRTGMLVVFLATTGLHYSTYADTAPSAPPNDTDQNMAQTNINTAAWLVGFWKGEGMGGVCEEAWSAPVGGAMMGMFRFIKDDKVIFYELMAISEADSGLVFKLKHFNPDLTGWEEKAATVDFAPVKADADGLTFEGLAYHKTGADAMEVVVKSKGKDGTSKDLVFSYQRVK